MTQQIQPIAAWPRNIKNMIGTLPAIPNHVVLTFHADGIGPPFYQDAHSEANWNEYFEVCRKCKTSPVILTIGYRHDPKDEVSLPQYSPEYRWHAYTERLDFLGLSELRKALFSGSIPHTIVVDNRQINPGPYSEKEKGEMFPEIKRTVDDLSGSRYVFSGGFIEFRQPYYVAGLRLHGGLELDWSWYAGHPGEGDDMTEKDNVLAWFEGLRATSSTKKEDEPIRTEVYHPDGPI